MKGCLCFGSDLVSRVFKLMTCLVNPLSTTFMCSEKYEISELRLAEIEYEEKNIHFRGHHMEVCYSWVGGL